MPKRAVKVSYQPAKTTPSERVRKKPTFQKVRPKKKRHDLHAYVRDNEDTGISVQELIEQYQEYECNHNPKEQEVIATTSTTLTLRCNGCRKITHKLRPGVKKDDAS